MHLDSHLDLSSAGGPPPSAVPSGPGVESVRLGPGAPHVPEELLKEPAGDERRHVMVDLAGFLLDRHLRRLATMRNPLELRLARLLGRLDSASGYLELGFARLADYVTERLGFSSRRAVDLLHMDRRLGDLPRASEAFASGRITASQLRALLRVLSPENEGEWIEKAAHLSVRALERDVRAAVDRAGESVAVDGPATAEVPAAGAEEASLDDDESEPGRVVGFACPASVRERWRWAVELCRRSAGAHEPVWRCAEYIAADYLSGAPDLASILAHACADDGRADRAAVPLQRGGRPEERADSDDSEMFEAVLLADGTPANDLRVVLPASIGDDPADGARDLDRKLRELVACRQGLAWEQGRLLSTFSRLGLHRTFGFTSFGRYCKERLGLGIRRARRLIALDRRLLGLPDLRAAYRRGLLSWVKTAAVARVADERSERAWLRIAASMTFRRLCEEVALVEDRIETDGFGGRSRGSHGRLPDLDAEGEPVIQSPWTRLAAPAPAEESQVSTCAWAADSPSPAARSQVSTCARPDSRVRFWAPDDVAALWRHALEVCRIAGGGALADWECVARMIDSFEETWDARRDPRWLRRFRIFERDGWRCRVPGCSSRRNLQAHHVVYRSRGGPDDDSNLAVLCATHHLKLLHAGRLRCRGPADGLLRWELGIGDGGPPILATVEDVVLPGADGPAAGAVLP